VDWIQLACDKNQCNDLVKKIIKLPSEKIEIFLE
jgi:hypothetical protein